MDSPRWADPGRHRQPDFAQVETDAPQISINTRFALFYPEKRAFFQEGGDLLQSPLQVLHTHSIVSPSWGARATGGFANGSYTLGHSSAGAVFTNRAEDTSNNHVVGPEVLWRPTETTRVSAQWWLLSRSRSKADGNTTDLSLSVSGRCSAPARFLFGTVPDGTN